MTRDKWHIKMLSPEFPNMWKFHVALCWAPNENIIKCVPHVKHENIFFISQSDYLIYDVLFPGLAWECAIRELRNLIRESRTSTGRVKKRMGAASAEHTYEQFRAVLCKTKAWDYHVYRFDDNLSRQP